MTRIAKSDVNAAFERAAKNIIDAAGKDGVTSRRDIKAKLSTLTSTEKALTDRVFRFMDARDYRPNARVTKPDVERATEYAKVHLLAKYDLNNNGYSKSEVAKMSITGQLAVRLAAEAKGITLPSPTTPTTDLGKAMTAAAKNTYYISESDSQPEFISASLAKNEVLTGETAMTLFHDRLAAAFFDDKKKHDLKEITFEELNAKDTREFLPGLADATGLTDDYEKDNAAGFARIQKVFADNLTDVKVFRTGFRDEDHPNQLASDAGAYEYLVLGRTADGKVAGVVFESVET